MFFVLSSGRSGSRTSSEVFSQFDNCDCLHHPQPELVLECTQYYYGENNKQEIVEQLRASRPDDDARGRVYGEVNLQLSLIHPILRELYPAAKYLWLIRDGRDVVASMYYRGWYDAPDNTKVPQVWHDARLDGHRTGDFSEADWQAMSRFAKCCWIWTKYNQIIEQTLATLPAEQWRQIQLEHFRAQLDDLALFLGLKSQKRIRIEKSNAAHQPVKTWQAWSDAQRQEFIAHCGETMDRFYPGWRDARGAWLELSKESPDRPGLATQWRQFQDGWQKLVRKMRRRLRRR